MTVSVVHYGNAVEISKSDTVAIPDGIIGLYVGGAGDVVVKTKLTGTTVTFKAVPVGTQLHTGPITHLMAATTATLVVGMYGR